MVIDEAASLRRSSLVPSCNCPSTIYTPGRLTKSITSSGISYGTFLSFLASTTERAIPFRSELPKESSRDLEGTNHFDLRREFSFVIHAFAVPPCNHMQLEGPSGGGGGFFFVLSSMCIDNILGRLSLYRNHDVDSDSISGFTADQELQGL